MRALSLAQASRCETAKHQNCRCRCGGVLHGRARVAVENPEPEVLRVFFEELAQDDPHHVRSKEEIKLRRKMRRDAAKKSPKQTAFWAD